MKAGIAPGVRFCITLAGLLLGCMVLVSQAVAAEAKAARPAKPKIDLNTAKEKQLRELPGIGEAYAKKIVAARPLKNLKDLAKIGIPGPTIEKITPLVSFSATRPAGKLKPPKKGLVWVNTDSKVFHREGSPWYGNTKEGIWLTEAEAVKAGNKAAGE